MYGLKPDIDFSFLFGKDLTQLAIGPADMQFNFAGPMPSDLSIPQSVASISVQSRITHRFKGLLNEWEGDENKPLSAASLLQLIGSSVVTVQGERDGTLTLGFSNGALVQIFDTEGYEAYQIYNGNQTIYV